ncbi:hypothetical protein [Mycobacterium bohemicum]|uniref:hypothetical protein n=1 Tax=Mycobacterium bohemicum TaxID=56425 RepID=UPI000B82E774|nr:hypothetical protein [Mycobacterium bohemicum]MCV6969265.1 hypothetical protein [Mycobacterium bohemicum]
MWRDAISVDWHGETADAMRVAVHADMVATSAVVDRLQAAAKVARGGATDLYGARSRLRYAVEEAQAAGFDVTEDFSVIDLSCASAVRHVDADSFAADIRQRAAQLVALDQQVAGGLTNAVAGIRDKFPHNPTSGTSPQRKIHAVDNHTFKQDPPPSGPPGSPFAGWTEEQKQQVASEIAHGHASLHFPDMTPPELARSIYDAMNDPNTRIGTSLKSGGLELLRTDGTVIFINPQDGDYGTAFRPEPRPNDRWRTPQEYFDQTTRAIEPLPPPRVGRLPPITPGEMASPVPAVQPPAGPATPRPSQGESPPAPVEPALTPKRVPPVRPGSTPNLGGGPLTPFGPSLVPPPHAGHHHSPVLGDTDPDPWDHGE